VKLAIKGEQLGGSFNHRGSRSFRLASKIFGSTEGDEAKSTIRVSIASGPAMIVGHLP
jgi:hypothetical protein